ncbi:nucleoside/nucleotide kinase family protein [Microbacterium enclense]|uniref:Nucleoside/nucleotide kinase family protein n=1 Tax=Microbacterium enclense TaxID=993073 RepID=A0A443JHR4_9MICO|nr:nucleoside/nucleotide kinase family protein [Microbacterium enclense]RWR20030.1 nucleoside/nucleotide kinase family protein [Microbacterium enclense]
MPAHDSPPADAVSTLADRVGWRASGSSRFLLGIAGSPGSGKTTLAAALVAELNAQRPGEAVALPMDGFHLANRTLDRLGRRDRKGAIDTFDGWGFLALLQRVHAETDHTVFAPSFRREVDEGVAGEIAIDPEARVVVVEGNYLLVDDGPWARVRDALDEAWFCETPDAIREARLVERHTHHGRTAEAATAWAREVDGANAALIEATRGRADLVVSGETGRVLT